MLGRVEEAVDILDAERSALREQDDRANTGFYGQMMSFIALRADNIELAEEILRDSCRYLETHGERGNFSTSAAKRAALLAQLGRLEDAEIWARQGD
jgi:hypothetical protein